MKVRDQRPEVGSRSGCAAGFRAICVFRGFPCCEVARLAYSNFPAPCDCYADSIRFYPFLCTFYALSMRFLCTFYIGFCFNTRRFPLEYASIAPRKKNAHCRRASREKERQKNVRQEDAREPPNVPLPLAQLPRRARGAWSGVPSHGWNMQQTRSVSALCRIPSAFRSRRRLAFVFFVLFRGGKPGRVSGEMRDRRAFPRLSQSSSKQLPSVPKHSQTPPSSFQMIPKRSQSFV